MSRIILSDVSKYGVSGANDYEPIKSEKYKKLCEEANKNIRLEKSLRGQILKENNNERYCNGINEKRNIGLKEYI